MINNLVISHAAKASAPYLLAGQFSHNQAFYDRVRSDFLRQSANYLRESLSKRRNVSST